MAKKTKDVKLSCEVDGDNGIFFIRIDLLNKDDKHITTLEFADISSDIKDLEEANKHIGLYKDEKLIRDDLASAYLFKFIGEDKDTNSTIKGLYDMVNKIRHKQSKCKDDCIYCNPDLGDDPLPDFVLEVKNSEPEGEA